MDKYSFGTQTATTDDLPFLWDMLYEAAAVSDELREVGKEIALKKPELKKYLENWGRTGDFAILAQDNTNGVKLAAAWYRLFEAARPGYGFVNEDVPELTIGVIPEARGKGVGTLLLKELVGCAKAQGYKALSLSVDRKNRAVNLYRRFGFKDAKVSKPGDSSVTLIKYL